MALTLAESAKLSQTTLQRGVIETFVQESPLLARIPLLSIQGNAYSYNAEATLPGVEFRAVNAAYAESTGTINQKTESLVILGGDADVDTFIQQTGSELNDQRATQARLKVKAVSYKFQDAFVNGDVVVDANGFDGLKKRLTGAQVINASATKLPVVGASDEARHAFFDKVDELLAAVDGEADVLLTNAAIQAKFRSSARRVGGWDMSRDEFGRGVETYNGVPVLNIGKTAAGGEIVPMNEPSGAGTPTTDTSSIYAVRFGQDEGDGGVTGLTNGGVQVKDLGEIDSKPVLRTRIELFCGLAVFSGRGAARLRYVENA